MAHCLPKKPAGLTKDMLDVVTDRLENCLVLEKGKQEFRDFLEKRRFNDELAALLFIFKCDEILKEVSKYSPKSRNNNFSKLLNNHISDLYDMADAVNFDSGQLENLEAAVESNDNDEVSSQNYFGLERHLSEILAGAWKK